MTDVTFGALREVIPRQLMAFLIRKRGNVSDKLNEAIKNLIEMRPKLISGFENNAHLHENKIKFSDPQPSFVWNELEGRAVQAVLNAWMINQQDPEHEDNNGVDILFVEPDITCRLAVRAWMCMNLTFDEIVAPSSTRDVANTLSSEVRVDFKVEKWTFQESALLLANEILTKINTLSANPWISSQDGKQLFALTGHLESFYGLNATFVPHLPTDEHGSYVTVIGYIPNGDMVVHLWEDKLVIIPMTRRDGASVSTVMHPFSLSFNAGEKIYFNNDGVPIKVLVNPKQV